MRPFMASRLHSHAAGQAVPDFTNLCDIMVVTLGALLLAAAPVYTTAISPTRLERGSGPQANATPGEVVVITFDRHGVMYWQGARLSGEEALVKRALELKSISAPVRIALAGDREAPYGISLRIKQALQAAGVRSVEEILRKEDSR